MKRVLTTVVLLPLALAAIFYLPDRWFWVFVVALIELAAWEAVRITDKWAPGSPRWLLLATVPVISFLIVAALTPGWRFESAAVVLLLLMLLSVGVGVLALLGRVPVEETIGFFGVVGWGTVYFATAAASLWYLRMMGAWVLILLLAVVWLGDSAAFYVGSAIGKHRLAPVVSPKKSWEGAIASTAAGLIAAAVWCHFLLGEIRLEILAVAAVASIAAQMGDLSVSMVKRGAGVKDSGTLLPGHGGMWDRLDAVLFAAPVLLLGLWLIGFDASSLP